MNLFVFYNFKNKKTWRYKKDLIWVGGGKTTPVFPLEATPYYSHEEQFIGDDETIDYLTHFFENLKVTGVVKNYKICENYDPTYNQ